jgi:hypothetical protein
MKLLLAVPLKFSKTHLKSFNKYIKYTYKINLKKYYK